MKRSRRHVVYRSIFYSLVLLGILAGLWYLRCARQAYDRLLAEGKRTEGRILAVSKSSGMWDSSQLLADVVIDYRDDHGSDHQFSEAWPWEVAQTAPGRTATVYYLESNPIVRRVSDEHWVIRDEDRPGSPLR